LKPFILLILVAIYLYAAIGRGDADRRAALSEGGVDALVDIARNHYREVDVQPSIGSAQAQFGRIVLGDAEADAAIRRFGVQALARPL